MRLRAQAISGSTGPLAWKSTALHYIIRVGFRFPIGILEVVLASRDLVQSSVPHLTLRFYTTGPAITVRCISAVASNWARTNLASARRRSSDEMATAR